MDRTRSFVSSSFSSLRRFHPNSKFDVYRVIAKLAKLRSEYDRELSPVLLPLQPPLNEECFVKVTTR